MVLTLLEDTVIKLTDVYVDRTHYLAADHISRVTEDGSLTTVAVGGHIVVVKESVLDIIGWIDDDKSRETCSCGQAPTSYASTD